MVFPYLLHQNENYLTGRSKLAFSCSGQAEQDELRGRKGEKKREAKYPFTHSVLWKQEEKIWGFTDWRNFISMSFCSHQIHVAPVTRCRTKRDCGGGEVTPARQLALTRLSNWNPFSPRSVSIIPWNFPPPAQTHIYVHLSLGGYVKKIQDSVWFLCSVRSSCLSLIISITEMTE